MRTALTTTGVAIGIAALSLIVALAGGLQDALTAPALVTSQVHQVAVYPVADAATPAFDAETLGTLSQVPHVRAAWGQIGMSGTFAPGAGPGAATQVPNRSGELVHRDRSPGDFEDAPSCSRVGGRATHDVGHILD